MTEDSTDQLKQAVEHEHGGTARFVESVPVKEEFLGKKVWEGPVAVFDLEGATKSTRAYAWSWSAEGSTKQRFFTMLHLGEITNPQEAVRAAIAQEQRREQDLSSKITKPAVDRFLKNLPGQSDRK